jgi:uncharacterized protein (TIGR00725 family)
MSASARSVAVLGGAGNCTPAQIRAAYVCGRELASRERYLITGATSGIPCAAALGAKDAGGLVVGISPARNATEHVKVYRKPLAWLDVVIYSGSSLDGRAQLILRSAGAAVFIGGEMGTLAEFAAGWLCGCPVLGLLEEMGGVTANLRRISTSMTSWGSKVVSADDPVRLIDEVCREDAVHWTTLEADHEVQRILAAVGELRKC